MSFFFNLNNIINNKTATIGIIGLGYVGLPLALLFEKKKFNVLGFDIDKNKIKFLKNGKSLIKHITDKSIKNSIDRRFNVTDNFTNINKLDIIILCLPTTLTKKFTPDLSYINDTMKNIFPYLKKGQLLILESSTYPGSTNELIIKKFISKKFKVGSDYFVGYSPEREDPSNKKFKLENITKLCSGFSKKCLITTNNLYKQIVKKTHTLNKIETAEFTKIYENIFRNVNIALVNEMKIIARRLNIDIFDTIKAAKTKPFGFQAFYPGPGVGGHCIPIDPYYLSWVAEKNNTKTEFIKLAGKVNLSMPKWIINQSIKYLKKNPKKVLLVGMAYKKNVDDMRESPGLDFIKIFQKKKIKVDYYDPYIKKIKSRKLTNSLESIKFTKINLIKYDVVYILTDHDIINYDLIKNYSKLIVDTRNVFKKNLPNVIKL